jgi:hypothetical protein
MKRKSLYILILSMCLIATYVWARTEDKVTFVEQGNRYAGCHGTVTLSLTNSAATTETVYCGGLPISRIYNTSGGALTITIYDASTRDGTACTTYDEDGVAVAALTVPNNSSCQLPSSLSGMTYCIMVLSSGSADVTVSFGR